MKRDKRERFLTLGEKRVTAAVNALRLVGNLSDKNNYNYDQHDVYDITKALKSELSSVIERFDTASKRESSSNFKFSKKA